MKEYRGYFRSCDTSVDERGQLFRVSIYAEFNRTPVLPYEIITLTDEPFTVEYEGEENNRQKPYKCSTATVNFIYESYNWQFSETNNNNMLVVLSKWRNNNYYEGDGLNGKWYYSYDTVVGHQEGSVAHTTVKDEYPSDTNFWETTWIGFGTPNTYNQSFEGVFDEVSINAQDALSTLKYVDYEPVNNTRSIVSFSDIIKTYISELGTYRYVYITDSIVARTEDFQDILHSLYIHENNFFDEDNKPMKVMEVIEQICQYLHISVIPYGDALYFLNYDGIQNEHNRYYLWVADNQDFSKFNLDNPTYTLISDKITLQDYHFILPVDFAENGTTLNVLDAFNKVTIKDDLYPYDSIIKEAELKENENKYIQGQSYHDTVPSSIETGGNILFSSNTMTKVKWGFLDSMEEHLLYLSFKNYNISDNLPTTVNTFWYPLDNYDAQNGDLTPNYTEDTTINANNRWNINTTQNFIGACIMDFKDIKYKRDEGPNITSIDTDRVIAIFQKCPSAYSNRHLDGEANISYDKKKFSPYLAPTQKMIEFVSNDVVIDKDTVIKIEGTFKFYGRLSTIPFEVENNATKVSTECCFVWCRLRCGNKYWNGTEWTVIGGGNTYFKLPIEWEDGKNAYYTDYKIISFDNTNDKKGYNDYYTVPVPVEDNNTYSRDITFTIYRTISPRLERMTPLTILRNFNISTKVVTNVADTKLLSKDNGSDTEYNQTNYSADYAKLEDYPEISSKISTWMKKYPNNSSVLVCPKFYENGWININSHLFQRLYTIYNKGLNKIYIPEDNIINSVQNHYRTPTITLSVNLKESLNIKPWATLNYEYFNGYNFVVNSSSYDYRWNKHTINLEARDYSPDDETVDDM